MILRSGIGFVSKVLSIRLWRRPPTIGDDEVVLRLYPSRRIVKVKDGNESNGNEGQPAPRRPR